MAFNPTRLTIARQRSGLTKKELANQIGVNPRAISGFESGQYSPTEDNIRRLSECLNFPYLYFLEDDIDLIEPSIVSFRSLSKMSARQRDSALSAGSLAVQLNRWAEREFTLPPTDIPDYAGVDPEIAAQSLRRYWILGEKPIPNLIHLLESKGVRVFSLVEDCKEVDAYSMWHGQRPFVFLNTIKSGEHRRFDAAHELGHLVLHRRASASGVDAERQAQEFAGAFLMPRDSLRAYGRIVPTLDNLMKIKAEWRVSLAALVVRLHKVGLMTYYHYNRLFVSLSRKGFKASEPHPIEPERSQVWHKVLGVLWKEGKTIDSVAGELALPVSELRRLVFGLAAPIPPQMPADGSGSHLREV